MNNDDRTIVNNDKTIVNNGNNPNPVNNNHSADKSSDATIVDNKRTVRAEATTANSNNQQKPASKPSRKLNLRNLLAGAGIGAAAGLGAGFVGFHQPSEPEQPTGSGQHTSQSSHSSHPADNHSADDDVQVTPVSPDGSGDPVVVPAEDISMGNVFYFDDNGYAVQMTIDGEDFVLVDTDNDGVYDVAYKASDPSQIDANTESFDISADNLHVDDVIAFNDMQNDSPEDVVVEVVEPVSPEGTVHIDEYPIIEIDDNIVQGESEYPTGEQYPGELAMGDDDYSVSDNSDGMSNGFENDTLDSMDFMM